MHLVPAPAKIITENPSVYKSVILMKMKQELFSFHSTLLERILMITKKSGNRERCRKLS